MPARGKAFDGNKPSDTEMQLIRSYSLITLSLDVILHIANHLEADAFFTLFYAMQCITRMRAVLTSALCQRKDLIEQYLARTYFQPIQLLPDHRAFISLADVFNNRPDVNLYIKISALLTAGSHNRGIASQLRPEEKNVLENMMYLPSDLYSYSDSLEAIRQLRSAEERANYFSMIRKKIKIGLTTNLLERRKYSKLLAHFVVLLPPFEVDAIFLENYQALIQLFQDTEKEIGYCNVPDIFFALFDRLKLDPKEKELLAKECEAMIQKIPSTHYPTPDRRKEYIRALSAIPSDENYRRFSKHYTFFHYYRYGNDNDNKYISLNRIFEKLRAPSKRHEELYDEIKPLTETTQSPSAT